VTGILNPLALLGLPILALLAVLIFARNRTQATRRERLGISTSLSPARAVVLSLIPCALMVLALLRPYSGSTEVTIPATTNDYMFVVDVSRSMFAKDVPPSRMELAKRKLKDLIDEFAKQGEPHRYGITLFAGYSYLLCPITDDAAVVKQFISEISPEMVTSLGSDLEAGMTTALSRFNQTNASSTRVLLVSDGEDNLLSLERVVELVSSKGIRVDVLGVGTTSGSPIELEDGSFVRSQTGSVVHSKLGEESLQAIAEAGSGTYVRATVDDRDIRELARSSLSLNRGTSQGNRTIHTYQEFGSWLAFGALVALLIIAARPRMGALIRILVCVLVCGESAWAAPLTSANARAAYELYEAGKYEEAVNAFKVAVDESPKDPAVLQGYASALYKVGKFPEAQKIFNSLASKSTKGRDYFENTYNEGNALLAMKRYQDAFDAFTKALDVKPDDERALHNKAVARALLEEEKNKPTPTPTPTPDPNQSPQPSPSPQGSPEQDDQDKQDQQQQQQQPQQQTPAQSPSAAPTPQESPSQGAATPSPNPSAQPSPSPDPQTPGSPSPEPQSSPSQGTPSPQPEQEHDERLKENQSEEEAPPPPESASTPMALDTQSPSEKEAQAWLESLPESPLLIRKERGRGKPGGQTW
jgi:Ca-activated chloride channel family protein